MTIQLKQCPRCRVAIRRNLRYGIIINQQLADIERVKRAVIGELTDYGTRTQAVLSQLKKLRCLPADTLNAYTQRLTSAAGDLSAAELTCVENVTRSSTNLPTQGSQTLFRQTLFRQMLFRLKFTTTDTSLRFTFTFTQGGTKISYVMESVA